MSNNIRVGDVVYLTHHMSNRGVVSEVFFRPVKAGIQTGPLSQEMWLRFTSNLTGEIMTVRRQDVTKDN